MIKEGPRHPPFHGGKWLVEERLTHSVIGAFYEVYNTLGFGFIESVYVAALTLELQGRGHQVGREVSVEILYKGHVLTTQRLDMIVDETLIVEAKATPLLHKSAPRQLYNYLRATRLTVGLLFHFGPEPAFYRVVHTDKDTPQTTLRAPRKRGTIGEAQPEDDPHAHTEPVPCSSGSASASFA